MAFDSFPFSQFLTEFPQGVFGAELGRSPLSSFQQRLLTPQYGNFAGQYQGELARQAQEGILPSQTFQDYLRSLDPYQQFYSRFGSPQSRGTLTRNPFTQFAYQQQRR